MMGGAVTAPLGIGGAAYRLERSYTDDDGDGIPDSLERSSTFNESLATLFGTDKFEGLDPTRRDLLIDVRYVGEASVSAETKATIRRLFRTNGIYLQWLEYPHRYEKSTFLEQYGHNAKRILWSPRSFYHREIEEWLLNVAFQLIVVPGIEQGPHQGRLYSPWTDLHGGRSDGYVNGLNTGNRAVVADRQTPEIETRLILHEIAHYALCHDTDPTNTGVMGTRKETDLMDYEWEQLRTGLSAIRDTTGVDVAFRRCLWWDLLGGRPSIPSAVADSIGCRGCEANLSD